MKRAAEFTFDEPSLSQANGDDWLEFDDENSSYLPNMSPAPPRKRTRLDSPPGTTNYSDISLAETTAVTPAPLERTLLPPWEEDSVEAFLLSFFREGENQSLSSDVDSSHDDTKEDDSTTRSCTEDKTESPHLEVTNFLSTEDICTDVAEPKQNN